MLLDTILFIFAAIILFYSISIHWTAVFFKARVHTFKKNVEVGRKPQELSFFVGDGLCRSDLIVGIYGQCKTLQIEISATLISSGHRVKKLDFS